MKTLWNNLADGELCEWGDAFEAAQEFISENDCLSVDLAEYRPSEASDICTEELTDEVWDCLDDLLRTQTDFGHDDGWPNLESLKGPIVAGRPKAWGHLRDAIQYVLDDHLDLTEAGWQPTGKTRRVTHDGTSYQWEEIT
jgi:hypothetical protein